MMMSNVPNVRNAAIALISAAAIAGCAGSASVAGPSVPATSVASLGARRGWLSPGATGERLVFVSDNAANAIMIYPQGRKNPSPIGEITDGISAPLGNFVDKNGTLYVANSGNGTVTEYPLGSTTPSATLSNYISGPISVAVDREGTVAVGEFASGMILEFPAGSSSPTVTISLLSRPEALAFDRSRHLYAAWNEDAGSGLTGQVSKCQRLQAVCVDQGMSEGESGGLAIDRAGDLILGDQTNHAINIYAPGATSPTRTINTGTHDPYKFELNSGQTSLYVADYQNNQVVKYDYATGVQTGVISAGLQSVWGVSLYPPESYAP
jgi:DNA-binding beta-propeller fold protein YncE